MAPFELDRSNSLSSSPLQGSDYNAESALHGYQARLLERTSSLSRSSSQSKGSNGGTILTPNGARRTHRIGASVDSLRGKLEDRTKEPDVGSENGIKILSSLRNGRPRADESTFKRPVSPTPQPRYRLTDTSLQPAPQLEPTRRLSFKGRFSTISSSYSQEGRTATSDPSTIPINLNTSPTPTFLKRQTLPQSFTNPDSAPSSPRAISPATTPSYGSPSRPLSTTGSPVSPVKRMSAQWEAASNLERTEVPSFSSPRSRRTNSVDVLMPTLTGSSSTSSTASSSTSSNAATLLNQTRSSSPSLSTSSQSTATNFRSSYMQGRRAGAYPDSLGHVGGRKKLGRHLPRIASGDGNPDWEEPEPPRKFQDDDILTERERARQRLEGQRLGGFSPQRKETPPPPSPSTPRSMVATLGEVSGVSDVTGVPGRLRLSKDAYIPSTPKSPRAPSRYTTQLWTESQRHMLQAYEYLCHVGEAQQWVEGCLNEELPFGVVEMDEGLRNGVVLAKLARVWEGEALVRRIFEHPKLQFKHSDNINYFFVFVRRQGLPENYIFELTDLYEKKNIPKVIYCIHALSHLLARKGMAQRIGNLVGRLQFTDDQLRQTQDGLNAAGVAMPNFGNLGKELAKDLNLEPEVEVETEDERNFRLLQENEDSIIQFQSFARGYILRRRLATQQARTRLAERSVLKLQARCRGLLVRRRVEEIRSDQMDLEPWVIALQAIARGYLARRAWRQRLARIRYVTQFVVQAQAQARGVLERRKYGKLKGALRSSKFSIVKLQALARAKMSRKTHVEAKKSLEAPVVMTGVINLQALAYGVLKRREVRKTLDDLHAVEMDIVGLQAHIRAALVRRRIRSQLAKLDGATDIVVRIQAACRAYLARQRLLGLIRGLKRATYSVIGLQAQARALIARRKREGVSKQLAEVKVRVAVQSFQAQARAAIARKRHQEQHKRLEFCTPDVVGLQAQIRGVLVRNDYYAWRDHLRNSHEDAIHLQALMRGVLQRRKFQQKMRYYRANLDKVVKIQALFRAKEQREQYRQLTMGTNVTVGTIKNFVHLLDDSEADFEDEINIERLRKKIVEGIRENQQLETDADELELKIALVVQNVKSFEELIKARRRHGADNAAAHAARASLLAAHGDPFAASTTLDHAAKRKLELYQQLFYLLQSRGEYLARLFFTLSRVEVDDKVRRMAERVVLTLFGYGQDRREDYLLLKLFQISIHEEIRTATSLQDIIHGHPMYINVVIQYIRPKQLAYVRDTLGTVIRDVVTMEGLDLETDPCAIYRKRTNDEEIESGKPSTRPTEVTFHEAVDDPETRAEFIRHLQMLHALTKDFVQAMVNSTKRMPYSMRCIARDLLLALRVKFPDETEEAFAVAIGKVIFYRLLNPAIVAPETFDIVHNTLSPHARRNLAEISKILIQITSGEVFGEDNPCLTPLNSYVETAITEMAWWLLDVADVPDAETHYHAHEFLDATVQPRPIYISPNEVYSMHGLLAQHLDHLVPGRDDPLRTIIAELDGVPNLGSAELKDARDRAITLELTNRFAQVQDPQADEKALWVQAKRGVLAILRVQPAKDLVESLMEPVTEDHEVVWEEIVEKELANEHMQQRKARMPSSTGYDTAYRLEDIKSLSFRDVKGHAIYFLLELEKLGKISRQDGYQDVLNAIAADVRSKHLKRVQRMHERDTMKEALAHLQQRKRQLEEKVGSYHSYAEAAMHTMQRGKGKKRIVMPFTKQYFHQRELQKQGKNPQFGSYKYSAHDLYDKGILLSIDQTSPRQFDKINIIISSNAVGVFNITAMDANLNVKTGDTDLKMEDLLQAHFENRTALSLFDGMAKFNLNLLLYQINKKFYV